MALNKQKKIHYIYHILQEVINNHILVIPDQEENVDDTILIEVALDFTKDFIEDLKEGKSDGGT
tara:strand:- start:375 stop:566 length:192 start_codon:yes stop_codon:yes gene_type:complete